MSGPEVSAASPISQAPWWTAADQAELDVLIAYFVELAWAHRVCRACHERGTMCGQLEAIWDEIEDWLKRRSLLSKAEYLRSIQCHADSTVNGSV